MGHFKNTSFWLLRFQTWRGTNYSWSIWHLIHRQITGADVDLCASSCRSTAPVIASVKRDVKSQKFLRQRCFKAIFHACENTDTPGWLTRYAHRCSYRCRSSCVMAPNDPRHRAWFPTSFHLPWPILLTAPRDHQDTSWRCELSSSLVCVPCAAYQGLGAGCLCGFSRQLW